MSQIFVIQNLTYKTVSIMCMTPLEAGISGLTTFAVPEAVLMVIPVLSLKYQFLMLCYKQCGI